MISPVSKIKSQVQNDIMIHDVNTQPLTIFALHLLVSITYSKFNLKLSSMDWGATQNQVICFSTRSSHSYKRNIESLHGSTTSIYLVHKLNFHTSISLLFMRN